MIDMSATMQAHFGITHIGTFVLGTILIIIMPGPNSLFVFAVAARRGAIEGYRAAFGVLLGDFMLVTLAAYGAASFLHRSPLLFTILKCAGGTYLSWIGLQMMLAGWRAMRAYPTRSGRAVEAFHEPAPFKKALAVSLMNPKAILFFISFFVQFIDATYKQPLVSFFVLGVICQTVAFFYLSALIFLGTRCAAAFAESGRLTSALTSCFGAIIFSLGVKMCIWAL